jgi:hypothetical protein
VYNLDTGRMPPMSWEDVTAEVPAGGGVHVDGSTVPEDEVWQLVGVSVFVPNDAPCYALLQLEPVAGEGQGRIDVAMTKNLPAGHDADLVDARVPRGLIIPSGGRLRAIVRNGGGQPAGDGTLTAIYLRWPRGRMPQGV